MRIMPARLLIPTLLLTFACACKSASPASSADPAATPTKLNWVNYTDTAEGAFSMDVPVGWQVQGGMYRFGYFDVRWMMDVRSLDGKIILRLDDVNVPPYVLPGPNTGAAGHPYTKPQQFQMIVSTFQQAQPYADQYAKHRFAGVCTSMTSRASIWTPNLPAAWANPSGTQASTASLAYDCPTSDGPRIVNAYVRTSLFSQSSGLWTADPVITIIATSDNLAQAQSMVQHMIGTWQKNPQWAQYQQQMTQMGLQQIMAGFNQFMQQMQAFDQQRTAAMNQQVAGFEAQQNAQAAQVSSWGDILTGVTNVSDPQTGAKFQVFSGPNANYYTNGNGVTINSTLSPGPGFHQVTPTQ